MICEFEVFSERKRTHRLAADPVSLQILSCDCQAWAQQAKRKKLVSQIDFCSHAQSLFQTLASRQKIASLLYQPSHPYMVHEEKISIAEAYKFIIDDDYIFLPAVEGKIYFQKSNNKAGFTMQNPEGAYVLYVSPSGNLGFDVVKGTHSFAMELVRSPDVSTYVNHIVFAKPITYTYRDYVKRLETFIPELRTNLAGRYALAFLCVIAADITSKRLLFNQTAGCVRIIQADAAFHHAKRFITDLTSKVPCYGPVSRQSKRPRYTVSTNNPAWMEAQPSKKYQIKYGAPIFAQGDNYVEVEAAVPEVHIVKQDANKLWADLGNGF